MGSRMMPAGFQAGEGAARLGSGPVHVPEQGGGQVFRLVRQHHRDLTAGAQGGLGGIGAAALAAEDQPLFLQNSQGGADGLTADAKLPAQGSFRGELLPPALTEPMLQLPGDDEIFRAHPPASFHSTGLL